MKYLNERTDFRLSDTCRKALMKYIDSKGKQEPINQAKVFSIDQIHKNFEIEPTTLAQIIFGECTLAKSSEFFFVKS